MKRNSFSVALEILWVIFFFGGRYVRSSVRVYMFVERERGGE
jgi:hypothetical protein